MIADNGYSFWMAAIFMMSFNAGLGVLALPHAIAGSGWYGLLLLFLASVNSCYSAVVLGRTWLILEERWEEYRGKFRYPYPAMGTRAVGHWMRYIVTGTLHISAMGIAVVYLLLSAQVAQSMTASFFSLSYHIWILTLACFLCPLTWFGSIEKFKFAGIGALATMVFACFSMLAGTILDISRVPKAEYLDPNFGSFSLSFGTILFAFGGIFFFPTVQNDMKNKGHFKKATLLSYAGLLIMYIPVAVAGYFVYGSGVNSNILLSLERGYLRTFIEVCLAIHTLLAFLLGINPVLQEVEEMLQINPEFNYKRCLVRSLIVFIILIVAYTIPHFDKVLNFIGGSTMTMLTFIFPPLFYFLIQNQVTKDVEVKSKLHILEQLFLLQIVIVGIAGGISCTYFAILDIVEVLDPAFDTNDTILGII